MAAEAKWLRLNVDWHESRWLADLPWHIRAVWTVVLTHVKSTGTNGVCREPVLKRFAATYDIPEECVTALCNAAVTDGALRIEDGEWVIANWDLYQLPDKGNAKRQQAYRDRQKALKEAASQVQNECENASNNGNVTDHNESITALRNATVQDSTRQDTTGTFIDPSDQGGAGEKKFADAVAYWQAANEPMRSVALCLCEVARLAGQKPPVAKEVTRHVGESQGCRQLVDKLGWQVAAELYDWCAKNLTGSAWSTVWANNPSYLQKMEIAKAGGIQPNQGQGRKKPQETPQEMVERMTREQENGN